MLRPPITRRRNNPSQIIRVGYRDTSMGIVVFIGTVICLKKLNYLHFEFDSSDF